MVRINTDEAELVLAALESKFREYAPFPPELQQVFLMPYQQLYMGIKTALEKEQTEKNSEPAPKDKK